MNVVHKMLFRFVHRCVQTSLESVLSYFLLHYVMAYVMLRYGKKLYFKYKLYLNSLLLVLYIVRKTLFI